MAAEGDTVDVGADFYILDTDATGPSGGAAPAAPKAAEPAPAATPAPAAPAAPAAAKTVSKRFHYRECRIHSPVSGSKLCLYRHIWWLSLNILINIIYLVYTLKFKITHFLFKVTLMAQNIFYQNHNKYHLYSQLLLHHHPQKLPQLKHQQEDQQLNQSLPRKHQHQLVELELRLEYQ